MKKHKAPANPRDLLQHRLLAFSFWKPRCHWNFVHVNGKDKERLTFQPYFSMNDYAGLAAALLAGVGIGDLPPLVQPELLHDGDWWRLCQSGNFGILTFRWSMRGLAMYREWCECSRNSQPEWHRSSFRSCRPSGCIERDYPIFGKYILIDPPS